MNANNNLLIGIAGLLTLNVKHDRAFLKMVHVRETAKPKCDRYTNLHQQIQFVPPCANVIR